MIPAIGGSVLVLVDPEQNGGQDAAVAFITAVWPDEAVNVRVFPNTPGPEYQLSGVRLYQTRQGALAGQRGGLLSAYPVEYIQAE